MLAHAERDAVTRRCVAIVRRDFRHLPAVVLAGVDGETAFADLNADGLDITSLVVTAEEEFGVCVDEDAAHRCTTVADFAALVGQAMAVHL